MGRLANERHVHFIYFPDFIAHWNEQPAELKQLCNDIGEPYGYTGINVFYVYFVQYWTHIEAGIDRRAYQTG